MELDTIRNFDFAGIWGKKKGNGKCDYPELVSERGENL
jgi:hypothetical protein